VGACWSRWKCRLCLVFCRDNSPVNGKINFPRPDDVIYRPTGCVITRRSNHPRNPTVASPARQFKLGPDNLCSNPTRPHPAARQSTVQPDGGLFSPTIYAPTPQSSFPPDTPRLCSPTTYCPTGGWPLQCDNLHILCPANVSSQLLPHFYHLNAVLCTHTVWQSIFLPALFFASIPKHVRVIQTWTRLSFTFPPRPRPNSKAGVFRVGECPIYSWPGFGASQEF
jgi:hypothetical protein